MCGGGFPNAEMMAVAPTCENALDHVVVMMFENRSFDNLLGRLYEPGEVDAFEGVGGRTWRIRYRTGPTTDRSAAASTTTSPPR